MKNFESFTLSATIKAITNIKKLMEEPETLQDIMEQWLIYRDQRLKGYTNLKKIFAYIGPYFTDKEGSILYDGKEQFDYNVECMATLSLRILDPYVEFLFLQSCSPALSNEKVIEIFSAAYDTEVLIMNHIRRLVHSDENLEMYILINKSLLQIRKNLGLESAFYKSEAIKIVANRIS